jgi:hypothetical protein
LENIKRLKMETSKFDIADYLGAAEKVRNRVDFRRSK